MGDDRWRDEAEVAKLTAQRKREQEITSRGSQSC